MAALGPPQETENRRPWFVLSDRDRVLALTLMIMYWPSFFVPFVRSTRWIPAGGMAILAIAAIREALRSTDDNWTLSETVRRLYLIVRGAFALWFACMVGLH
jgi:hypothetical protein